MKICVCFFLLTISLWAQCGSTVLNPLTGQRECVVHWSDNGRTITPSINHSIFLGGTLPGGAPNGSIAISGRYYGDGRALTNLPSGFADPMSNIGDMIFRSDTGTTRLPAPASLNLGIISVDDGSGNKIPAWGQVGHNNQSGLQGGTTGEYYHLTSAQHATTTANNHNSQAGLQGGTAAEYYHLTSAQQAMTARYAVQNVMAYGATGNGSTDDTTAIRAAFAAAPAGGTVVFPDAVGYKFNTITITKAVRIEVGSGTLTALSNPMFSVGTTKGFVLHGSGKLTTILTPAVASGWVISMGAATNDSAEISDLTITGNSSASGGWIIDGAHNGYRAQEKIVAGRKVFDPDVLNGSNQGLFIDCDFSAAAIGVHFTRDSITGATVNLNTFLRGSIMANVIAIKAESSGAGHQKNTFREVNFLANTGSPSVVILSALGWKFEGCFWELNGAGLSTIQLGDATYYSQGHIFEDNYVSESNVTYWIDAVRGDGNLYYRNWKGSSGQTAMVRIEAYSTGNVFGWNKGSGPATDASDVGGAVDTFYIGTSMGFWKKWDGTNRYTSGTNLDFKIGRNIYVPAIKATSGTRFVCVDTDGKLVSQTTACSGT